MGFKKNCTLSSIERKSSFYLLLIFWNDSPAYTAFLFYAADGIVAVRLLKSSSDRLLLLRNKDSNDVWSRAQECGY